IWHIRQDNDKKPGIIDGSYTMQLEGSPSLAAGSNMLWGSGTVTPPLHWFDGAPVGIRVFAGPFQNGDSNALVAWTSSVTGIYRQITDVFRFSPFLGAYYWATD